MWYEQEDVISVCESGRCGVSRTMLFLYVKAGDGLCQKEQVHLRLLVKGGGVLYAKEGVLPMGEERCVVYDAPFSRRIAP
jgi:hypothetical protein